MLKFKAFDGQGTSDWSFGAAATSDLLKIGTCTILKQMKNFDQVNIFVYNDKAFI